MANLAMIRRGRKAQPLSIPEGGLRFGRHQMNDLVLKDKLLPLFHGRIYFQEDGSLWINNFTNDGLVTVDGHAICSRQLETGHIIHIGTQTLRVLDGGTAPAAPAPVAVAPTTHTYSQPALAAETSTATTTHCTQPTPQKKQARIPAAALLLYLMIAVGIAGYAKRDLLKATFFPQAAVAAPSLTLDYVKEQSLVLMYQQLRGDHDHMIRYALELNKEGLLSVQIYDLLTDHIIERSAYINQEEIASLSKKILKSGFNKAPAESASACSAQGEYSIFNIILEQDGVYHEAKVLNNIMPVYVKNVVNVIEGTASEKLNVPVAWKMSNRHLLECLTTYGVEEDRIPTESDNYYERLHASTRQLKDAETYLNTLESCTLTHEVSEAQHLVMDKLADSYNGRTMNHSNTAQDSSATEQIAERPIL